jgi:hypothetical protein
MALNDLLQGMQSGGGAGAPRGVPPGAVPPGMPPGIASMAGSGGAAIGNEGIKKLGRSVVAAMVKVMSFLVPVFGTNNKDGETILRAMKSLQAVAGDADPKDVVAAIKTLVGSLPAGMQGSNPLDQITPLLGGGAPGTPPGAPPGMPPGAPQGMPPGMPPGAMPPGAPPPNVPPGGASALLGGGGGGGNG